MIIYVRKFAYPYWATISASSRMAKANCKYLLFFMVYCKVTGNTSLYEILGINCSKRSVLKLDCKIWTEQTYKESWIKGYKISVNFALSRFGNPRDRTHLTIWNNAKYDDVSKFFHFSIKKEFRDFWKIRTKIVLVKTCEKIFLLYLLLFQCFRVMIYKLIFFSLYLFNISMYSKR